jgi:hypothetical protein
MDSTSVASLINIVGFTVGIALYAMLAVMVARTASGSVKGLLGATALLGLLWNAGELALVVVQDLNLAVSPLLSALAYSAVGFLPSVVVHSAVASHTLRKWVIGLTYGLSSIAAILHLYEAIAAHTAPSGDALRFLTVGAVVLATVLLVLNFREPVERKAVWGTALLVFAAGAFHLSDPGDEKSWIVELLAHQSSLPLAMIILYQNYRFAFADLFLKRAVSFILLAATAFGLYTFVAVPFARLHEGHSATDVQAVGVMLALWMATALAYPTLYRFAVRFVDKVILDRPDYQRLQIEIADEIDGLDSSDEVMTVLARELGRALTAGERSVGIADPANTPGPVSVSPDRDRTTISIPTHEPPFHTITLGCFEGGRRLLSDETAMLESAAHHAARKIDGLRATHERCDRELRENEISKLAAEAQLTALRAQINPHFLFNALTTIGYLIQTSPEKAFATLLHLTKLLRNVLSSTAEFTTLGEEIRLIKNYLEIEHARFEEKLNVEIEIDTEAGLLRIPALIVQPLVENAIKHAIAENNDGGSVRIRAAVDDSRNEHSLVISVADTGSGASNGVARFAAGHGIRNIEERLHSHYGERAELTIRIDTVNGSVSSVRIPVNELEEGGEVRKGQTRRSDASNAIKL